VSNAVQGHEVISVNSMNMFANEDGIDMVKIKKDSYRSPPQRDEAGEPPEN